MRLFGIFGGGKPAAVPTAKSALDYLKEAKDEITSLTPKIYALIKNFKSASEGSSQFFGSIETHAGHVGRIIALIRSVIAIDRKIEVAGVGAVTKGKAEKGAERALQHLGAVVTSFEEIGKYNGKKLNKSSKSEIASLLDKAYNSLNSAYNELMWAKNQLLRGMREV